MLLSVDPMQTLRRILPWLIIPIAIAGLYDGWIFYSRWDDARQAKARRVQQEGEAARKSLRESGGDEAKILSFGASDGVLRRGQHTNLCYSVTSAAKLRVEPDVPNVYPAYFNCVDIAPDKTTVYRLVATDKGGKSVDARLTIQVK